MFKKICLLVLLIAGCTGSSPLPERDATDAAMIAVGIDFTAVAFKKKCKAPEVNCNGVCVNLYNNTLNCGFCGHSCAGAPHVTGAACSAGGCVGTCTAGWGDCDGDKSACGGGCETSLNTAQSTSPATYAPGDLAAGYTRVAAITNCGACGSTCDDGNPRTTDLCVPAGSGASCQHYDRAQCAGARCGGLEAAGADSDGDGLSDAWETVQVNPYTSTANPAAGIDLDCNGTIDAAADLIWHEAPSPAVKDVYLQYDYMATGGGSNLSCTTDADCMGDCTAADGSDCDLLSGVMQNERCVGNACLHTHDPPPRAVTLVTAAFTNAGMALHIDPVHRQVAEVSPVYFPTTSGDAGGCAGESFYIIKSANFDSRRRLGYHYALFAHNNCLSGSQETGATGIAESRGNDLIVSMGSTTTVYSANTNVIARANDTAGTFLHELGHNFGLKHGGNDDNAQKPNYISVMSYLNQLSGIYRASLAGCLPFATGPYLYPCMYDPTTPWRVDFSHETLPTLNEAALDESLGIGSTLAPYNQDITKYFPGPASAPVSGGVDWNEDGVIGGVVSVDIDNTGTTVLTGYNDWANLALAFQCEPTFGD